MFQTTNQSYKIYLAHRSLDFTNKHVDSIRTIMQNYDLAADDSWDWTREQIHPTKLGVLYRECVFHADNTYVGKVHAPIFQTTGIWAANWIHRIIVDSIIPFATLDYPSALEKSGKKGKTWKNIIPRYPWYIPHGSKYLLRKCLGY